MIELRLDWSKIKWRDSLGRINPLIVKNFERSLKRLIREMNIDPDALDHVDLASLIDPALSPEENLKLIADKLKLISMGPTDDLDTALTYLEMQLDYERRWCEELGWEICPETETMRQYRELQRLIKPRRRPRRKRLKRKSIRYITLEIHTKYRPLSQFLDPNAPPLKEPLRVPKDVWAVISDFAIRYRP